MHFRSPNFSEAAADDVHTANKDGRHERGTADDEAAGLESR